MCDSALTTDEVVGIVIVPCCYHHLSEETDFREDKQPNMTSQFETGIARGIDKEVLVTTPESELEKKYIGFPKSKFYVKKDVKIGRNIRMLACHSKNRTEASYYVDRDLRSTNAVYFRGLLKMIMVEFFPKALDVDGRELKVGKLYKKIEYKESPFLDYCRLAFDKFKIVGHRDILTDGYIVEYERTKREEGSLTNVRQFEALRETFAGPAEALILLDKLLYIKESEKFSWLNLVQVFDPIKSPRAFAFVGYK